MPEHDPAANPYVGLRPFGRSDSFYFFGRREQTAELLESLYGTQFLAVVGSSGCGKSSLIRAGLIPALLGGFLVEERADWRIGVMKPGDAPLRNLAAALCDDDGDGRPGEDQVATLLEAISERHTEAVAEHVAPILGEGANQLLLIDQFEEIFSFRGSDEFHLADLGREQRQQRRKRRAEAADFVDLVVKLAARNDLPLYTVLTMRTDFLGDCDLFYGLPEAMNRGRYLVPRLNRQQLRETIEGPALLSGSRLAPRLLDLLLNRLGDRSDRLPVLQHALLRTWDSWIEAGGEGAIDLEHYRAAGTLENALSMHAEEAMREDDERATEHIFRRLTDTDVAVRRVRRPSTISDLVAVSGVERREVEAILERFSEGGRHFVYRSAGATAGDPRVDISHESLIRRWQRLRDWVDQERDSRDRYVEIVKGAHRHEAGRVGFLQDPELQINLDWSASQNPTKEWARRYQRKPADFEVAMDYLDRSREAARAAERRRRRRRNTLIASGITVLAIILGFLSYANLEKRRRVDNSLVSEAKEMLATDPTRAAGMLARIRSPDALGTLRMAGALNFGLTERELDGHDGPVWTASFSPDGDRVLSASEDGTARIWRVTPEAGQRSTRGGAAKEPIVLENGQDGPDPRTTVAFSPDGTQVVAASEDGTVELWSVVDALANEEAVPLVLRGHAARVNSAVFSSDGEALVTASDDRTARIWPLTGAGAPRVLEGHEDSVLAASFSPDGRQVVTASGDGTARVWEVAGATSPVMLTGHAGAVVAASFCCPKGSAPTTSGNAGKLVVTASEDGTAKIWNIEWRAGVVSLQGHEGALAHAEFSPDGSKVVTASTDGTARVWEVPDLAPEAFREQPPEEPPEELAEEPSATDRVRPLLRWVHPPSVLHAEFSPDGSRVLTASADQTARLWRLDGSGEPVVLPGHGGAVRSATFSADGTKVVTSGSDGKVRIWTAEGETIPTPDALSEHAIVHAELIRLERGPELAVAASRDGSVRLWQLGDPEGRLLNSPRVGAPVAGAWFDPTGELVVTVAAQEARVWRAADGERMAALKGHEKPINSAAFDPRGALIVTASDDGTARVWTTQGDSIAILDPHGDDASARTELIARAELSHAEFSPDGSRLVVSSKDGTARVWTAAGGPGDSPDALASAWRLQSSVDPIELGPHEGAVTFASFDPRGDRVVTASRDGLARIWTLGSDSRPIVLKGHRKPIYVARFSHDGTRVVTASRDLTARIWRADGFDAEPLELIGHEGPLTAAAFSRDDDSVLTASEDGTARIWQTDGSDRRNPLVLLRYGGPVRAAAFSPRGDRVVTASNNGRVQVWGIERLGVPTKVLEKHRGGVFAASFDRKGSRVVTASEDGTALLWVPGSEAYPLAGPSGEGRAAVFSPDGKSVAIAMLDGTVRIWSADGSELSAVLGEVGTALADLAFSPDGRRLVTAAGDGSVRVWAIPDTTSSPPPAEPPPSAELPLLLEGHSRGVGGVAFSPDGRRIVTASVDGTVRIWNAESGVETARLTRRRRPVWRARFDAEGARVVAGSLDGGLWIWTPESGEPLQLQEPSNPSILSALFSPGGRRVASVDDGGTLKIWDAESGAQLAELKGRAPGFAFDPGHPDGMLTIPQEQDPDTRIVAGELSPDREWVATVANDGTVMLRSPKGAPGLSPLVLAGTRGDVLAAAFKPDGSRVWTFSAYGLREWRLRGSKRPVFKRQDYLEAPKEVRIASFDPNATRVVWVDDAGEAWVWATDPSARPVALRGEARGRVRNVGFSRDGRSVATGSEDGTARVWDALTGNPLRALEGHRFPLRDISFSPDGQRLVTASEDGTARIWDVATGKEIAVLSGHRFAVRAAEFSPDGTEVVTASDDGTARTWDPTTGAMRHELKGHAGQVLAASFSPRGNKIVTASDDGTARVWLGGSLCTISPRCRGEGDAILLLGHRGPILTAAFDGRGDKILTTSQDGTVRIWQLSGKALLTAIREATIHDDKR